jgi:hypothetical protein
MKHIQFTFFSLIFSFSIPSWSKTVAVCDVKTIIDHSIEYNQHEEIDMMSIVNCQGRYSGVVAVKNTPLFFQYHALAACDPSLIPGSKLPTSSEYIESIEILDSNYDLIGSTFNRIPGIMQATADQSLELQAVTTVNNLRYYVDADCKIEKK